jgi:hypothetical protein
MYRPNLRDHLLFAGTRFVHALRPATFAMVDLLAGALQQYGQVDDFAFVAVRGHRNHLQSYRIFNRIFTNLILADYI